MQSEYEAISLSSAAEKKMKPGCWDAMCTNKEQRLDDARDLYEKAGNKYKLAQLWFEAGECFEKAGLIQEGKKERATQFYEEAAFCFNFADKKRARENSEKCLRLHEQSGDFISAGKLTQKIADDFVLENNNEEAIKHYKKAADYYQMVFANTKSLRQECLLKYANLLCLTDHPDAFIEAKTDYLSAEAYLSKFLKECPSFNHENEYDLLMGVINGLKVSSELEFKKACTEYNRVNELDKWKSHMLNKILSKISSQNKYSDTDDYR